WSSAIRRRSRSTRCNARMSGSRAGACSRRPSHRCSSSTSRCRATLIRRRSNSCLACRLDRASSRDPTTASARGQDVGSREELDPTYEVECRGFLMRNGNADHIAALIEPGRVHRDVYTDPDLFELEMARIFGRAWLFVGHVSQVPQPGDYV